MPYGPWLSDWYTSQALSLHSSFMKIYENKNVLILDFVFCLSFLFTPCHDSCFMLIQIYRYISLYKSFKSEKFLIGYFK